MSYGLKSVDFIQIPKLLLYNFRFSFERATVFHGGWMALILDGLGRGKRGGYFGTKSAVIGARTGEKL